MNVLITGGAGYIGSHVAVELYKAGHTPIIIDNFDNSRKEVLDSITELTGKRPRLYEGDVCDETFLDDVFSSEDHIDGVIHFAGLKAVGESIEKPLPYYYNNITGLLSVLKAMQKYKVPHFVFSSSATVYGDPESNPIPESAQRKEATNPYGNTKSISEDIIRDTVTSGIPLKAIALRYFNPIGAHPSGLIGELPLGTPANLVPYLTQAAAGLRAELSVFGDDYDTPDGTGVRDFIHVVDLAKAHIATLEYLTTKVKSPFYDIYNVGTGNGVSVKQLIDTFEEVNAVKVPFKIAPRRAGDIASCWADPTKININMHWRAEKTLKDSLKDAWNWQKGLPK